MGVHMARRKKNKGKRHTVKPNLLASLKSAPTLIETRVLESSVESVRLKKQFSENFNEEATSLNQHCLATVTTESLPEIDGENSMLRWHETPEKALRKLLAFARSPSECEQITKKDLDYVIYCYKYTGKFPLTSRNILRKLAVRILSYLAKNKKKLPDAAIKTIYRELRKSNRETTNYAALALAYAVLNGQQNIPAKTYKQLRRAYVELTELNELRYFHSRVILLAALARHGQELSEEELEFLRHAIANPTDRELQQYYPKKSNVAKYRKGRGLRPWRTQFQECENMLGTVEAGELLTETQMLYLPRQYNDGTDVRVQTRIILTITAAILNQQRHFPEQTKVVSKLTKAVKHDECKIKESAIIALTYLLQAGDLRESTKLNHRLNSALDDQRSYALSALNDYLCNGRRKIANVNKWVKSLEALRKSVGDNKKLYQTANYLLFNLNNKIEHLEELILDKDNCIAASLAIVNAARNKIELRDKTLNKIELLLSTKFSDEAKINCLMALSIAIENGKLISPGMLEVIIKNCLSSKNRLLIQNALAAIASYIKARPQEMCRFELVSYLHKLAIKKVCQQNIACILTNYFSSFSQGGSTKIIKDTLPAIFDLLVQKLLCEFATDESSQNAAVENILLAFGKATKVKFQFLKVTIETLQLVIASSKVVLSNRKFKRQLLSILGGVLENCNNRKFPRVFDSTSDSLVNMLADEDERIRNDAASLLSLIINKSKQSISQKNTIKIVDYMRQESHRATAIALLNEVAQARFQCAPECVHLLIDVLIDADDSDALAIAKLLVSLTAYDQRFRANEIKMLVNDLQVVLLKYDNQIAEHIVLCLNNLIEVMPGNEIEIVFPEQQAIYLRLTNIIGDASAFVLTRIKASNVLRALSCNSIRFPLEVISCLASLINFRDADLSKNVIRALCNQISQQSLSIRNKNKVLLNLLAIVQEKVADKNVAVEAISILTKAYAFGYREISAETQSILADILQGEVDKDIRNEALNLFNRIGIDSSNEKLKVIKRLVVNSIKFKNAHINPQCISLIKELTEIANSGCHLVIHNLEDIERVILEHKDSEIYQHALNLCVAVVNNRQKLTHGLTQFILNEVLNNSNSPHGDLYTIIISGLIKNGATVSQQIFVAIEQYIIKSVQIHPFHIDALEIALRRGYKFSKKAFDNLIFIIKCHDSSAIKLQLIHLLENAVDLQTNSSLSIYQLIQIISSCSEETSCLELVSLLSLLIVKKNNGLTEDQLENLIRVANDIEFYSVKASLVKIIKQYSSLTDATASNLQDKKLALYDSDILPAEFVMIFNEVFSEICQKTAWQLNNEVLKRLFGILDTVDAKSRTAALKNIVLIEADGKFDDALIDITLNALKKNNDTAVCLEILSQFVARRHRFKGQYVDDLFELMLRHECKTITTTIYNLLVKIGEYKTFDHKYIALMSIANISVEDENGTDKYKAVEIIINVLQKKQRYFKSKF